MSKSRESGIFSIYQTAHQFLMNNAENNANEKFKDYIEALRECTADNESSFANRLFLLAVRKGDITFLEQIFGKHIAEYVNHQQKDVSEWTPLHFAVSYNQPKMVQFLIANGADYTYRPSVNQTSLLKRAVQFGKSHSELSQMLLKLFSDKKLVNEEELFQLLSLSVSNSIKEHDLELINVLIQSAPEIVHHEGGVNPLHAAILVRDNKTILLSLIKTGKANLDKLLNAVDAEKHTPLQIGIDGTAKNNEKNTELLLAVGAKPDSALNDLKANREKANQEPWMKARLVSNNQSFFALLLAQHGICYLEADLYQELKKEGLLLSDRLYLTYSKNSSYEDGLEYRLCFYRKNSFTEVEWNSEYLIKSLKGFLDDEHAGDVKKSAESQKRQAEIDLDISETAIQFANNAQFAGQPLYLLQQEIKAEIRNDLSSTTTEVQFRKLSRKFILELFFSIVRVGNAEVLKQIFGKHISHFINKKYKTSQDNDTPIHHAVIWALNGNTEMVKFLLDSGADYTVQSYAARLTPLQQAIQGDKYQIGKLILDKAIQDKKTNEIELTGCLFTILHQGQLKQDHVELVKTLIGAISNITTQNDLGETLLNLAAKIPNNKDMILSIVQRDPGMVNSGVLNALDGHIHSALHDCALSNIPLLLALGAEHVDSALTYHQNVRAWKNTDDKNNSILNLMLARNHIVYMSKELYSQLKQQNLLSHENIYVIESSPNQLVFFDSKDQLHEIALEISLMVQDIFITICNSLNNLAIMERINAFDHRLRAIIRQNTSRNYSGINLTHTDTTQFDLTHSNLNGAIFTKEQLMKAPSLVGVRMSVETLKQNGFQFNLGTNFNDRYGKDVIDLREKIVADHKTYFKSETDFAALLNTMWEFKTDKQSIIRFQKNKKDLRGEYIDMDSYKDIMREGQLRLIQLARENGFSYSSQYDQQLDVVCSTSYLGWEYKNPATLIKGSSTSSSSSKKTNTAAVSTTTTTTSTTTTTTTTSTNNASSSPTQSGGLTADYLQALLTAEQYVDGLQNVNDDVKTILKFLLTYSQIFYKNQTHDDVSVQIEKLVLPEILNMPEISLKKLRDLMNDSDPSEDPGRTALTRGLKYLNANMFADQKKWLGFIVKEKVFTAKDAIDLFITYGLERREIETHIAYLNLDQDSLTIARHLISIGLNNRLKTVKEKHNVVREWIEKHKNQMQTDPAYSAKIKSTFSLMMTFTKDKTAEYFAALQYFATALNGRSLQDELDEAIDPKQTFKDSRYSITDAASNPFSKLSLSMWNSTTSSSQPFSQVVKQDNEGTIHSEEEQQTQNPNPYPKWDDLPEEIQAHLFQNALIFKGLNAESARKVWENSNRDPQFLSTCKRDWKDARLKTDFLDQYSLSNPTSIIVSGNSVFPSVEKKMSESEKVMEIIRNEISKIAQSNNTLPQKKELLVNCIENCLIKHVGYWKTIDHSYQGGMLGSMKRRIPFHPTGTLSLNSFQIIQEQIKKIVLRDFFNGIDEKQALNTSNTYKSISLMLSDYEKSVEKNSKQNTHSSQINDNDEDDSTCKL